ncbi:Mor transcription activator family protein [uncultured Oscillibacter sp.]|uniref:Mor transcription activator family protein n=1 Tax=uncultured Oscillibacter sp. TaxID=876091 RepID=UPI0025E121C5|nr:Mor transcription activator family protein [uncultured Oscillibacter sp.]
MNDTKTIRLEDVPEDQRDLAAALGLDAYLRLAALRGGQELYVPKLQSLERGPRDRDIRARFDGGNYRELAARHQLSVRQVRKILSGTRT